MMKRQSLFLALVSITLLLGQQVYAQGSTVTDAGSCVLVCQSGGTTPGGTTSVASSLAANPDVTTAGSTGDSGSDVTFSGSATAGGVTQASADTSVTTAAGDTQTAGNSADDVTTAGSDVTVAQGESAATSAAPADTEATQDSSVVVPVAQTKAPASDTTESATQAAGDATVAVVKESTTGASQAAVEVTQGVTTKAEGEVTAGATEKDAAEATTSAAPPAPVVTEGETKVTKAPPEATYTVTSIPVKPYLMVNTTGGGYTGYIIDILDRLKILMNVEFTLRMVADGKYGKKEGDSWTGMIGEVARGEVDLAAAPLTVTSEREEVVDFTHPFMSYSAAVVIGQRPPYSSPENLQDLVDMGYNFAVTRDSNIYKVLQESTDPLHQKVVENIQNNDGLKESNNAGVHRARYDLKYAFFMESNTAEWIIHQEPCNLVMITTELYKRKYAFAVNNLSPLRDVFNAAITDLQNLNALDDLQDKWFRGTQCGGSGVIKGSAFTTVILLCISFFHGFSA